MKQHNTPQATVRRLCIYKRFLERLAFIGQPETSSMDIGKRTGYPAYQVRKDISYIGEVGVVGRGYETTKLLKRIAEHLRLTTTHPCIVVGMGSLGTALVGFFSMVRTQLQVVAGIDVDRTKTGRVVAGTTILHTDDLEETIRRQAVRVALLTVPAGAAQETANRLARCGVPAILNFTPVILDTPDEVARRDVDFAIELEMLLYQLAAKNGAGGAAREDVAERQLGYSPN